MDERMTIYISPQQGIKELVNKLESRLDTLANRMRARPDRLRVDLAYQIPFRDQATVDEQKGIEVCALSGQEAAFHAIYGLTAIRIEQGKQNPPRNPQSPWCYRFAARLALGALRAKHRQA